uniref:ABC-type xenobiotic transporter n=1 Tax=Yamagishiella unicocca TaxID=51707 RepID=A0A1W6R6P1_9CHLO|nr:multidrug resistance-associated protein [Yamagishiella unicocca]
MPPRTIGHSKWDTCWFSWLTPLMQTGSSRQLQADDLLLLDPSMQPGRCGRRLWLNWSKELLVRPGSPSLLWALARTYGRPYAWLGLVKLINDLLSFAGPLLLKLLVTWLVTARPSSSPPAPPAAIQGLPWPGAGAVDPMGDAGSDRGDDSHGSGDGNDPWAWWRALMAALGPASPRFGYVCVVLLGLASVGRSLLNAHYYYQLSRLSCQLRAGLMCILYRKSLLAVRHDPPPPEEPQPGTGARLSCRRGGGEGAPGRSAGAGVLRDGADAGGESSRGGGAGEEEGSSSAGGGKGKGATGREDVSTLMSVDAGRAVNLLVSFHELWSLPAQMVLALYLLYTQVRYAFVAGLAVSLLLVPANRLIMRYIMVASTDMMAAKDARVSAMSELLRGIRAVKLAPQWEAFYVSKVSSARRSELRSLAVRKYLDALCVYFWAATTLLFSALTFGLVVLLGGAAALTPAVAFTSLSLFQLLTVPLNAFPWVVNGVAEAVVSVRRLQRYLLRSETKALWAYDDLKLNLRSPHTVIRISAADSADSASTDVAETSPLLPSLSPVAGASTSANVVEAIAATATLALLPPPPSPAPPPEEPDGAAASLCNAYLAWDEAAHPCLYDICLSIPRGRLTVIVGRVGAGKSSLLAALLGGGELPVLRGTCRTFVQRLAYAPQQPWVTAGTFRENVLLGSPLDDHLYEQVLHDCALLPDLAAMPARDLTSVGDNGCNLSGGQRARLGLARALYHAASSSSSSSALPRAAPTPANPGEPGPQRDVLVLLDDVLASLDRSCAAHIVENALLGRMLLPRAPSSELGRETELEQGLEAGVGPVSQAGQMQAREKLRGGPTVVLATNDPRCIRAASLVVVLEGGRVAYVGGPTRYFESGHCLHRHNHTHAHTRSHHREHVHEPGNDRHGGQELQPGDRQGQGQGHGQVQEALLEGVDGSEGSSSGGRGDSDSDVGGATASGGVPAKGGAAADPPSPATEGQCQAGRSEGDQEEREVGHVRLHMYGRYGAAVGPAIVVTVLLSLALMQASRNANDLWVSYFAAHSASVTAAGPWAVPPITAAAATTVSCTPLASGASNGTLLPRSLLRECGPETGSGWVSGPGYSPWPGGSSLFASASRLPPVLRWCAGAGTVWPHPLAAVGGLGAGAGQLWQPLAATICPAAAVMMPLSPVMLPDPAMEAAAAIEGATVLPSAARITAVPDSTINTLVADVATNTITVVDVATVELEAGHVATARGMVDLTAGGGTSGDGLEQQRNQHTQQEQSSLDHRHHHHRHALEKQPVQHLLEQHAGQQQVVEGQKQKEQPVGLVAAMNSSSNSTDNSGRHNAFDMASTLPHLTSMAWSSRVFLLGVLVIASANSVFTLARAFSFALAGMRAAAILHEQLLTAVLAAPMTFFDTVPHGRILNRFSSDVSKVDDSLPFILNIALANMASLAGLLLVMCYSAPLLLPLLVPLALLYRRMQIYYRGSSREIRRLDALALSPVYGAFGGVAEAAPIIRAFGVQRHFLDRAVQAVTQYQRAAITAGAATSWLGLRLQLLASSLVVAVAGLAVWRGSGEGGSSGGTGLAPGNGRSGSGGNSGLAASLAGLSLAYVLPVVELLHGLLSSTAETEQEMVAVERLTQYTDLKPQPLTLPPLTPAASAGAYENMLLDAAGVQEPLLQKPAAVLFDRVVVRYRPGLPPALDGLSLVVRAGEHVGLCGRTGAGKSSVVAALLRLVEVEAGRVLLYGMDVRAIPLPRLRSSVGVLPQSPFVASASVRENLDPRSAAGAVAGLAATTVDAAASAVLGPGGAPLSDTMLCAALHRVGLWDALSAAAVHRQSRLATSNRGSGGGAAASSVPAAPCRVGVEAVRASLDAGTQAGAGLGPCVGTRERAVLGLPLGSLPNAVGLSAGQQQLLCLARLLLRPRRLVLLDECSAHVDPTTAAIIRRLVSEELLLRQPQVCADAAASMATQVGQPPRALPGLSHPCAVLEVAHDLAAIIGCDRVVVMGAGQVVEVGSPAELLHREGGHFRALHLADGEETKAADGEVAGVTAGCVISSSTKIGGDDVTG